jgi:hypothetical protein
MTTRQLRAELARHAARLAGNVPLWTLDWAAREIVSVIATARLGSAIEGELGELDPVGLWDLADKTAALARDYPRWPQYREQALTRWRELSRRSRPRIGVKVY